MATLKQSTAYTRMFFMVQSSDHVTALTGATPAVTLSKAGGAFASAGGTVTEVANGWYKIALTTTDTGTLGDLAYHITATSGDPSDLCDQVTANILGDTLPVNVLTVNGTNQTAKDLGASATQTGDSYARLGAPTGASVSADIASVPTNVLGSTVETGLTFLQALRLMASVLFGKVSGLPGSPAFRDYGDTKNRVTATTDSNGNRSAVTRDGT